MYFIIHATTECVSSYSFTWVVKLLHLERDFRLLILINLQTFLPSKAVSTMAPVLREGRDGRDVLRGALADLMKVKTTGVVPRSQARTIAVPWTSRTRLSDSVGVSVPSAASGSSTFPARTIARSVPVLGHTSLTSAVANCQFLSVPQRWVGTRGGNSASTTSSAWSVPGRSPCSTPGAARPVPRSS